MTTQTPFTDGDIVFWQTSRAKAFDTYIGLVLNPDSYNPSMIFGDPGLDTLVQFWNAVMKSWCSFPEWSDSKDLILIGNVYGLGLV